MENVASPKHVENKPSAYDPKYDLNRQENVMPPSILQENKNNWDLEAILKELGMGKFQYINLFLYGIPLLFCSYSYFSFVFTAADLDYRCLIAECENETSAYQTNWIYSAIPVDANDQLNKCFRYSSNKSYWSQTKRPIVESCNNQMFNKKTLTKCDKWIYTKEETSIASEFDIACDRKKLTFVGTLNSIGQFIGLPWAGLLADRYGRKLVIVVGTIVASIFALLRSYSRSYLQFLSFEFLEATFSTGIYSTGLALGIELVSSEQRPLAGAIIGIFYSIGAVLMGLIMWWVRDWRLLLRVIYTPGFLFALYIWIVPESIHWLQANGRHRDVLKILSKAAGTNNKLGLRTLIKSKSSQLLFLKEIDENNSYADRRFASNAGVKSERSLKLAFTSRTILFRTIVCSYCWIAVTLVFYGLSLNSVELVSGNKYLSFIAVHLIEVPAYFIVLPICKHFSRRMSQLVILVACGLGCITFQFIPRSMIWLKSSCYVMNKFMISTSANIIYIYTAEIFPTDLRLFLTGLCSTIGRIGCILAPQTPLLNVYFGPYAIVTVFSVVSISAGFLILLLPETKNCTLKSTILEMERNLL